jgi:NAD(P)-dependent dehydrogenase (short-subunit alcohol dehydrogenase family)
VAERKVAVVTGTSSGIGLHTALGLAHREDIQVIATMRELGRADQLRAAAKEQGVDLAVRQLDVTDRGSRLQALDEIAAEFGTVGVLINNAGVGIAGSLEQLEDAALQAQLEVNFLGVAALTRHVLGPMRRAGAGRIITVTSNGGVQGEPFLDAYCASKFAVEGLMQSLAPVAARFGVVVSVVEPAAVATNIVQNTDTGRLAVDPDGQYGPLAAKFLAFVADGFSAPQSAPEAAAVVVEAATTATPRFRWQTSPAAVSLAALSLRDLDGAMVAAAMSQILE